MLSFKFRMLGPLTPINLKPKT
ncbi:hypothetical protein PITCH_A1740048 [uncultured Desulfobacterium sp.]|uniref:Uncharacterized protein n=1 Tax=uncultured Desulfobacterium sp. TaxID=201089 RepID=A0A445MV24_9BACT|nr:hypothetical protein PITCH_A1740048 [uncultured Desulfobacterium sp.]